MHAIEKIMAHAAGAEMVQTGEIYELEIDRAMVHDRSGPKCMEMLKKYNIQDEPFVRPENVLAFFDHDVPSSKAKSAENQKLWREYAATKGIRHIFGIQSGISHQVMMERGFVLPGTMIVGGDSHTTNGGVLGALATGIGETEMTAVLITGRLWFKVPSIVKIELNLTRGKPIPHPKDVMLFLLKHFGTGSFIYTAAEFCGSYIEALDIDQRSVVTSMSCELGTKFGYIQPDEKAIQYLQKHAAGMEYTVYDTDPGYSFLREYSFCVDDLPHLVAQPHGFKDILPISDVKPVSVQQVVIGTCTGGLLEDLRITAGILRGKTIAQGVRLIVTPVSQQVYLQAFEAGYIKDIVEAGGVLNPPRCGPCGSGHDGLVAAGEVCVTNGCRNFRGRLGSTEADIYLASTAVAATSALYGQISVPE